MIAKLHILTPLFSPASAQGKADGEGRMVKRLYRKLKIQLHRIITHGGENNAMSKYMPPFGDELSDENIGDLVRFIKKAPEKYARPINP